MNIFLMAILLCLFDDAAVLPTGRGARKASRTRAIAHNRRIYNYIVGGEIWFDQPWHDEAHFRIHHPEWEGLYVPYPYKEGYAHTKPQQGRWETHYFKTRSIIDTGRIHAGDKHRKGKRAYKNQHCDKVRYRQLMADYAEYGE